MRLDLVVNDDRLIDWLIDWCFRVWSRPFPLLILPQAIRMTSELEAETTRTAELRKVLEQQTVKLRAENEQLLTARDKAQDTVAKLTLDLATVHSDCNSLNTRIREMEQQLTSANSHRDTLLHRCRALEQQTTALEIVVKDEKNGHAQTVRLLEDMTAMVCCSVYECALSRQTAPLHWPLYAVYLGQFQKETALLEGQRAAAMSKLALKAVQDELAVVTTSLVNAVCCLCLRHAV
jgi:hypothetical protein